MRQWRSGFSLTVMHRHRRGACECFCFGDKGNCSRLIPDAIRPQWAQKPLLRCATVQGKQLLSDLRNEETICAMIRFWAYALFPQTNLSVHVLWVLQKQNTVIANDKSITNRSSNTHIGELKLRDGGGGHVNNAPVADVQIPKINVDG